METYEYCFEEIKKCFLCEKWIENNYCRMIIKNQRFYFHNTCGILVKKAMSINA
jgi:hypothetical protein